MTQSRDGRGAGFGRPRAPLVFTLTAAVATCACSPSPRDVVPVSRDVHVAGDGPDVRDVGSGSGEAYEYVARRPHGAVALAEARHMTDEDARALVDRISDSLERCAAGLEAEGRLTDGAARVVAVAGPNGTPAVNVRVAPGDAVAQTALVCIVAPVRAAALPPSKTGTPGFAIEATWGPRGAPEGP